MLWNQENICVIFPDYFCMLICILKEERRRRRRLFYAIEIVSYHFNRHVITLIIIEIKTKKEKLEENLFAFSFFKVSEEIFFNNLLFLKINHNQGDRCENKNFSVEHQQRVCKEIKSPYLQVIFSSMFFIHGKPW